MLIYAGIDEAGYGPKFGPMTIGMSVMAIKEAPTALELIEKPLNLWEKLGKVVCKDIKTSKTGKLPVNDSKKIKTASSGVKHIERSLLSFMKCGGLEISTLDEFMSYCGESSWQDVPVWYEATDEKPWTKLPKCCTVGELAIDSAMLEKELKVQEVKPMDFRAAVLFEKQFNEMVSKTHSKASASFTFVSRHIDYVWQRYGHLKPYVAVDRQGGRTRYRDILVACFPGTRVDVIEEKTVRSAYTITSYDNQKMMVVSFEVGSELVHMPTALASMLSKYLREMLMYRFQAYFLKIAPDIKPCAGYGADAKRFWAELEPNLEMMDIQTHEIRRMS